jgi:hypothetical protein
MTRLKAALPAALVLLLTSACGEERPPASGSRHVRLVPAVAVPVAPPPVSPEQVDAAREGLTAADMEVRAKAIDRLLETGWSHRDLVRLVLRHVKWDEDRGALADLASRHPEGTLGPLVHRVGHATPAHRGQLSRALGRPVARPALATAILVVRSLFEGDPAVRAEAKAALARVSPGAVGLDPRTALEVSADPFYERALLAALEMEARRSSVATWIRLTHLALTLGLPADTEEVLVHFAGATRPGAAQDLALALGHGVVDLPALLRQGGALSTAGRGVASMGESGRALAPLLVRALDRHLSRGASRDDAATAAVMWAVAATGCRDARVQSTLVELLGGPLHPADRARIEAGLRVMRPAGEALECLLGRLATWPRNADGVAGSALAVVAWCAPEARPRVARWLETREVERRAHVHLLAQIRRTIALDEDGVARELETMRRELAAAGRQ